jgi:hypothetical protein
MWLRAPVTAGGDSSTWAGPLASAQNRATSEIVALAARRNGFEQMLPQMRRVPFNVAVAAETTSVEASWVGAGKPKPISAGALATIDALEPLKLAGVVVVTDELARLASAEQALARAISRALAQMQDETFFGVAAAVANVSPAGVFNGAPTRPPR